MAVFRQAGRASGNLVAMRDNIGRSRPSYFRPCLRGYIIITVSKTISLNPGLCAIHRLAGMFLKCRREAGMPQRRLVLFQGNLSVAMSGIS
jgi:hypothetical protein